LNGTECQAKRRLRHYFIPQRNKKEGLFYLVDGRSAESLKTTVRLIAQAKLDQCIREKFRIDGGLTVKEYYDRWVETKKNRWKEKASRDRIAKR
jgi:hypothetical protein